MELQDHYPNEVERAELLREGKIRNGQRGKLASGCTSPCQISLLALILATLLVVCAILISQDKDGSWNKKNKTSDKSIRCWQPSLDLRHNMQVPNATRNLSISSMQGLAFRPEDSRLYEVHTNGMRVYSLMDGSLEMISNRSYNLKTDFPKIPSTPPFPVAHIGGIAWDKENNVIWLSTLNNMSQSVPGAGALMAVDAESLESKNTIDPILEWEGSPYDWVAIDNDICIGYFGAFLNVRDIKRFNTKNTSETMDDLHLILPEEYNSTGLMYIQSCTIGPDGELMLIGDDLQTTLYSINVKTGTLLFTQALLIGGDVDGLAYVSVFDVLLVGLNRKAHEKIKQESILRLQPYFGELAEQKYCDLSSWKAEELQDMADQKRV